MRVKTALLYGFLALWLLTFVSWVWAEASPRIQAIDHVIENGGVAVLVSMGTKDTLSGDQVGQAVATKFESVYDVPTSYFVRQSTADYGFLEFFVWKASTGPHGADEWDTPEEAKALFYDVYITYLAALTKTLD